MEIAGLVASRVMSSKPEYQVIAPGQHTAGQWSICPIKNDQLWRGIPHCARPAGQTTKCQPQHWITFGPTSAILEQHWTYVGLMYCVQDASGASWPRFPGFTPQLTQNICVTFIQCRTNVKNGQPALYKCYTNVLWLSTQKVHIPLHKSQKSILSHLTSHYKWWMRTINTDKVHKAKAIYVNKSLPEINIGIPIITL